MNPEPMDTVDLFSVREKVALVTGGARGLGRGLAECLVRAGAVVYISSRKIEEGRRAAEELRTLGRCEALCANLSTSEGATSLASQFAEREPKLHILVNNAGRNWGAPFETFPNEGWASVMPINVQTPFTLIRDLLPQLRAAGTLADPARVINIASIVGHSAISVSAFSYSASKAAIIHLSRVLAAELAKYHINVNSISPGYLELGMMADLPNDPVKLRDTLAQIPAGRLGVAEDIGGVCLLLSSRAGAFITAVNIPVDGGMTGCR